MNISYFKPLRQICDIERNEIKRGEKVGLLCYQTVFLFPGRCTFRSEWSICTDGVVITGGGRRGQGEERQEEKKRPSGVSAESAE